MDVARPYLALLQPVRAATLLALRRTVAPMTGREVARRAGVSQPAALEALKQFVEHGLVWSQPAGGANLYSLNEEHLLVAAVDELFDVRAKFVNRMAAAVSHWEIPPLHVSVFGSMARGDGGRGSDIDVLVVRPGSGDDDSDDVVWRSQLDTLVREVRLWTGNRAAVVELSSEELRTMNHDKHRLLTEIQRDGIRICGEYLDKILLQKPERARQRSVAR
ncbi:MAG: nucleotidyltransferase domain-containing protein [Solirubrobacteraceae bacterium]